MPFYRPEYIDSAATGWYDSDNQATVMKTKLALFDSDAAGDSDGAKFSFGTAGQALVSGGDGTTIKWGSAGGLVPLEAKSGNVTDLYFDTILDDGLYIGYRIVIDQIFNTSNSLVALQCSHGTDSDGGPWVTSGASVYTDETGTSSEVRSQSTTYCMVAKSDYYGRSTSTIELITTWDQFNVTSQGFYNPGTAGSGTTNGVWQSWGKIDGGAGAGSLIKRIGLHSISGNMSISATLYGYLRPS